MQLSVFHAVLARALSQFTSYVISTRYKIIHGQYSLNNGAKNLYEYELNLDNVIIDFYRGLCIVQHPRTGKIQFHIQGQERDNA